MKLYEFEGKQLFRNMGIPVPDGDVASSIEAVRTAGNRLGCPLAVKSQILGGGRGKSGGIQFAENQGELVEKASGLLESTLAGEAVRKLLIEKKIEGAKEYYAGVTLDPQESAPVLMVSPQGGMDIEEMARDAPGRVHTLVLDPTRPTQPYHMLDLAGKAGATGGELLRVSKILQCLVACYYRYEAFTVEINPLMIGPDGTAFAADSKFEIDDSALFRLPEIRALERPGTVSDPLEAEAADAGVSYVPMEGGNIGIISGGAGLAMASMDMVSLHGGRPANFLDLGGGTTPEKAAAALKIVLKTPGVEGVLFNVFGGINNCEEMAKGIARVVDALDPPQAIVVKMRGYSQQEGWALLEARNVPVVKFGTTEEAVVMMMEAMRKRAAGKHGDSGR